MNKIDTGNKIDFNTHLNVLISWQETSIQDVKKLYRQAEINNFKQFLFLIFFYNVLF